MAAVSLEYQAGEHAPPKITKLGRGSDPFAAARTSVYNLQKGQKQPAGTFHSLQQYPLIGKHMSSSPPKMTKLFRGPVLSVPARKGYCHPPKRTKIARKLSSVCDSQTPELLALNVPQHLKVWGSATNPAAWAGQGYPLQRITTKRPCSIFSTWPLSFVQGSIPPPKMIKLERGPDPSVARASELHTSKWQKLIKKKPIYIRSSWTQE